MEEERGAEVIYTNKNKGGGGGDKPGMSEDHGIVLLQYPSISLISLTSSPISVLSGQEASREEAEGGRDESG